MLAAPDFDVPDLRDAYGLIRKAVDAAGFPIERMPTTLVMRTNEPLIRGLRKIFAKTRSVAGCGSAVKPSVTASLKMGTSIESSERHISRRPSMALEMVTSSANSRSLPTGIPIAMRVTRTPSGFSSRARYTAVASPSTVGLVAMITS